VAGRPYESVTLVDSLYQRRAALEPSGSWFTAMTAALAMMESDLGVTLVKSAPVRRGLKAVFTVSTFHILDVLGPPSTG
jgi:hypothetical protein